MAKKRDIEGNRLHHFELSDKNRTVRWILIGLLLAVGAVAVIIGLISVLQTPAGWQAVEASSTNMNCGHAFAFRYDLGAGEKSASVESKELSIYYGQLADKAWNLFYNEAEASEDKGIGYLNRHPNETVEVDEGLYKALSVFEKYDSRAMYLAPVYSVYDQVILGYDATISQDRDPVQNEEVAQYVSELMAFISDPQAVDLELLSGNQVKLTVSESYLQFAKENEIELFLDFGWLKNAAAIDYMADALEEAGYVNGYLMSVDGFQRNLDTRDTIYELEIFRGEADGSKLTAKMQYTAPTAIAMLQAYRADPDRYYRFENGRVVSLMVDTADGMCKAAAESLTAYGDMGCLALSAQLQPLYVADALSEDGINALTEKGIYSVWIRDGKICYNQPDLPIESQDENYTVVVVK